MRLVVLAVTAASLAACNQPAPQPEASAEPAVVPAPPIEATALPVDASSTASPTPTPSASLAAPQLVPEAEKGVKGARNVLLEWARALERRDFARADAQWGAGARDAKSAAQFAKYRRITVGFGDGTVEGGAGSLYYEVPVTLTLDAAKRTGTVTLRRVNDVDGATPEQLRWHLAGLNLGD